MHEYLTHIPFLLTPVKFIFYLIQVEVLDPNSWEILGFREGPHDFVAGGNKDGM